MAQLPSVALLMILLSSTSVNTGGLHRRVPFTPSCRTDDAPCVEVIQSDGCTLCHCKRIAYRPTETWPSLYTRVHLGTNVPGIYDDVNNAQESPPPSCKTLECAKGWTCVHDTILCKDEHRCGPHCVQTEQSSDLKETEGVMPAGDDVEEPNEKHPLTGVVEIGHKSNAEHGNIH